eukprot:TRINITY_DN13545_c0_g2_i1.p1 TRINITY_DN13545_c0_g2~~TRINITY_DN13545_c0_g2_i1.p1  ORF type:complete len:304 (+),score=73.63 TRINITY_DN13545_c0_g2_i1:128-1039(+)
MCAREPPGAVPPGTSGRAAAAVPGDAFDKLVDALKRVGYFDHFGPSRPQYPWEPLRVQAGDSFSLRCLVHYLVHSYHYRFYNWIFSADGAGFDPEHDWKLRADTRQYLSRLPQLASALGVRAPHVDLCDPGITPGAKMSHVAAVILAGARRVDQLNADGECADSDGSEDFALNQGKMAAKWRKLEDKGRVEKLRGASWSETVPREFSGSSGTGRSTRARESIARNQGPELPDPLLQADLGELSVERVLSDSANGGIYESALSSAGSNGQWYSHSTSPDQFRSAALRRLCNKHGDLMAGRQASP